ncbi:MAG: hypothetical protein EXR79_01815 [Myxococcales bacterium]|nr:hypothetical protein [Myxococcales bacterium]
MRFLHTPLLAASLTAASALAACDQQADICSSAGGVTVCGDFGTASWVVAPGLAVEWPPVAIDDGRIVLARGSGLVQVDRTGKLSSVAKFDAPSAAPSADTDGTLFVASGTTSTSVRSLSNVAGADAHWVASVPGAPAGTPPTIGKGVVHVATGSAASATTALHTLQANDGKVLKTRQNASPAAVMEDGSLRYLSQTTGTDGFSGPSLFRKLIAEQASGAIAWGHEDAQGIVDFAPGPAGETYIVTGGTHQLRRISAQGNVEWSFSAPCQDCTVAAAPTVTGDVVYFPVWERHDQELIDPLYALDAKTGALRWTYDGFNTKRSNFAAYKYLNPASAATSAPIDTTHTKHHPAGRPVVAHDRTLFVSTDGAVSALDKNGQIIGVAIYDTSAGETSSTGEFGRTANTWIVPGVRPSPVLGADGTLYVWDGSTIRAFATKKPAAREVWVAPFGGPSNSGRVPM